MAKFDAGKAVESVDYDFTKYGGPSGVIAEPTEAGLAGFTKVLDDLIGSAKTEQTLIEQANEMTREIEAKQAGRAQGKRAKKPEPEPEPDITYTSLLDRGSDYIARMIPPAGDLCQQSPSAEDMLALPYRVRVAFIEFLIEEFITGSGDDSPPEPAPEPTSG